MSAQQDVYGRRDFLFSAHWESGVKSNSRDLFAPNSGVHFLIVDEIMLALKEA